MVSSSFVRVELSIVILVVLRTWPGRCGSITASLLVVSSASLPMLVTATLVLSAVWPEACFPYIDRIGLPGLRTSYIGKVEALLRRLNNGLSVGMLVAIITMLTSSDAQMTKVTKFHVKSPRSPSMWIS